MNMESYFSFIPPTEDLIPKCADLIGINCALYQPESAHLNLSRDSFYHCASEFLNIEGVLQNSIVAITKNSREIVACVIGIPLKSLYSSIKNPVKIGEKLENKLRIEKLNRDALDLFVSKYISKQEFIEMELRLILEFLEIAQEQNLVMNDIVFNIFVCVNQKYIAFNLTKELIKKQSNLLCKNGFNKSMMLITKASLTNQIGYRQHKTQNLIKVNIIMYEEKTLSEYKNKSIRNHFQLSDQDTVFRLENTLVKGDTVEVSGQLLLSHFKSTDDAKF